MNDTPSQNSSGDGMLVTDERELAMIEQHRRSLRLKAKQDAANQAILEETVAESTLLGQIAFWQGQESSGITSREMAVAFTARGTYLTPPLHHG